MRYGQVFETLDQSMIVRCIARSEADAIFKHLDLYHRFKSEGTGMLYLPNIVGMYEIQVEKLNKYNFIFLDNSQT
jgi:hypothetical protein